LDPASPVPVYQQIHDGIVVAIARGQLRAGDVLDPVRRVAAEFGVNPATVQKAYDELRSEGLIESSSRSGSRIAATPNRAPDLTAIRPILARALAQGADPSTLRELLDDELDSLQLKVSAT